MLFGEIVATLLLGGFASIISLFDFLYFKRDPNRPLWKLRRIRAVFTVLLGFVLIVVVGQVLAFSMGEISRIAVAYLIVYLSFTFFAVTLLGLYGFFTAKKKLQQRREYTSRDAGWENAVRYMLIIWKEGLTAFYDELQNIEAKSALEYLDSLIDFNLGFFDALVTSIDNEPGVRGYINFIERNLRQYLVYLWEDSTSGRLKRYRACVYFLPSSSDKLIYLAGVAPQNRSFSRKPLPLERSTAGYALTHVWEVHSTLSTSNPNADPPYSPRESAEFYKSITSCAIRLLNAPIEEKPYLVLTVDSLDVDLEKLEGFAKRMLSGFALLLADAQAVMKITRQDINLFFEEQA